MRQLYIYLIGILCFMGLVRFTNAEVPQLINYQGVLTDFDNKPIRNQIISLEFRIYDAPIGGDQKWMETQIDTTDNNGAININLGATGTIPDSVFSGLDRWLGVRIDTNPEISPRIRLVSVPYAYKAIQADTATFARNGIPAGVIVMWSGTLDDIPDGWALCDGSNGTPNLRDKFIKSIPNNSTDPGAIGGSLSHGHGSQTGDHTLTIDEMPSHSHEIAFFPHEGGGAVYPHSHQAWDAYDPVNRSTSGSGGNQPHSHPINSTGSNQPPYYEMAFIIKL
ncbi:MAG: hypothetical protein V3V99_13045 [candidate division Zixibacteria bacterium]